MRTVALCAAGITLIVLAMWHRPADADDFAPFYRAATLASAHNSVYANPSWSPKKNAEGRFLPYLRTPFYAAVLRPLAALPYETARRVWIGVLVLSVFACVWLVPAGRNRLAVGLAFSFPLADTLIVGQDIVLVLVIVLAAARIFSSGREFLAGMAASLLAIKVTFLPAAGIVFLAKSRRGVCGFLTGIAFQLAISFAVGGAGWPSEYLAVLRNPLLDLEPGRMLNFRGVAGSLALPVAVYVVAGVALYVGLWIAGKRLSLADGLTIALPLGLIASPHCKVYDAVVLVPLFVAVASLDSWAGILAYAALTPVLYVIVLTGSPPILPAACALVIVSTLAAAWRLYTVRRGQMNANNKHATVPAAMATP